MYIYNCTQKATGDTQTHYLQYSGGFSGSYIAAYLTLWESRLTGAPGFNEEDDKFSFVFGFTVAVYHTLQSCWDIFVFLLVLNNHRRERRDITGRKRERNSQTRFVFWSLQLCDKHLKERNQWCINVMLTTK